MEFKSEPTTVLPLRQNKALLDSYNTVYIVLSTPSIHHTTHTHTHTHTCTWATTQKTHRNHTEGWVYKQVSGFKWTKYASTLLLQHHKTGSASTPLSVTWGSPGSVLHVWTSSWPPRPWGGRCSCARLSLWGRTARWSARWCRPGPPPCHPGSGSYLGSWGWGKTHTSSEYGHRHMCT